MSALGQKQTCAVQYGMSALPPIATAKANSRKRSCPLYPQQSATCSVSGPMFRIGTSLILVDPKFEEVAMPRSLASTLSNMSEKTNDVVGPPHAQYSGARPRRRSARRLRNPAVPVHRRRRNRVPADTRRPRMLDVRRKARGMESRQALRRRRQMHC